MKKTRAFTLIEMLIVVGIIAILISILVPALGRSRDQAKSAKCANNLKQIGVALGSYAIMHGIMPTPGNWHDLSGQNFLSNSNLDWPEALVVEGHVDRQTTGDFKWSSGAMRGLFVCPNHDPAYQNGKGTGADVNLDLQSGIGDNHDGYGLASQVHGARAANLNPAHIMAADGYVDLPKGDVGDFTTGYTELGPADYTLTLPPTRGDYGVFQRHMGTKYYRIPTTAGSYEASKGTPVRYRDGHGANYLMVGGQVEWSVEYGHICSDITGAGRLTPLDIWQQP